MTISDILKLAAEVERNADLYGEKPEPILDLTNAVFDLLSRPTISWKKGNFQWVDIETAWALKPHEKRVLAVELLRDADEEDAKQKADPIH